MVWRGISDTGPIHPVDGVIDDGGGMEWNGTERNGNISLRASVWNDWRRRFEFLSWLYGSDRYVEYSGQVARRQVGRGRGALAVMERENWEMKREG